MACGVTLCDAQGDEELRALVDILMLSFRKRCCSLSVLIELCNAIKKASAVSSLSQEISVKLNLMPMLGYGFWKLMDGTSVETHPFRSEFAEADKFFVEWSYDENNVQNGITHLSWHLFRRVFTHSIPSASGSTKLPLLEFYSGEAEHSVASESMIDISSVPSVLDSALKMMDGIPRCSLSRECLLMMMDACLCESSIIRNQQQAMKAFRIISDICQGRLFRSQLLFHVFIGDYYVCRALIAFPNHRNLQELLDEALSWFPINPQPIMILLTGLCYPEFSIQLEAFLSRRDFGTLVIHSEEDQSGIIPGSNVGTARTTTILKPTLGSQIPIPMVRHAQ